jgi:hypothetical protein
MKLGDRATLYSHNGFIRFVDIVGFGIPDPLVGQKTCYRTNDDALFYMKPELNTGKHYNVGNSAFWIIRIQH